MQTVNKEIWKTILMAPPSATQTKTQAPTKKKTSKAAFRKMRHIFDMLDTFDVHHDISDTDQVMAQIAHQRELRRRLHKKRTCPSDNLTLAERILKQRQEPESEIKPRSLSAPPMNLEKSATSLASVQSSPATAYATEQARRSPLPDSAADSQKSNNELDVPNTNAILQQNSIVSNVGSEIVVGEQTEVQVDVHAGNVSTANVSEADSSSGESLTSGEEPRKDTETQDSIASETCLIPGDIDPAQHIEKADVAKKNTATTNDTDESNSREETDGIQIEQQDKTPTCKSKGTNNPGNTKWRTSPSFLRSNGPRTGGGEVGNSPETIPLENLSKDINDGDEIDDTTCPLELVTRLERELFTDEERALLAQRQQHRGDDKDSDALERIMTGEFERELKASLHA